MAYPVKRPLLWTVGFFACGIVCANYWPLAGVWGIAGAGALLAILWWALKKELRGLAFFAAFCAGAALLSYTALPEEAIAPYLGQEAVLTGHISDSPNGRYYLVLAVEELDGERLPHGGQALIKKPYDDQTVYERGMTITAAGTLQPLLGATNPGGFDAKGYWNSEGVFYQLKAQKPLVITAESQGLWRKCLDWRKRLEDTLQQALPEEQYHLVTALLFGDKGELDQDFYSLSQKFGIAHVFAVSGLHIGYLVMVCMLLLRLLRIERSWLAVVLLAVALAVYCLMIGLPPSALRASIMAILGLLAVKWLRYKDMYTIMAVAALVILIGQPRALWSIGFQLSFAAAWGLIYLYQPLEKALVWLKWPWLRGALSVALAAQLVSAPLVAYHFYLFSAYAPLVNVVIVPLVGILVPLLIGALAVSLCLPFLAELAFLPCELLLRVITLLLQGLAAVLGTGHHYVGQPKLWGMIVYFLLLIAWREGWLKYLANRWQKGLMLAAAAAILCWSLPSTPVHDQVTFLDVGQGSSAVAQSAGGRVVVFDSGIAADTTANYLRYCGINTIDAVVLSHGDADHSTGLANIFRDFRVDYFFLAANAQEMPEVQTLIRSAQAQQTHIFLVDQESTLRLDDSHYLTVGSFGAAGEDSNAQEVIASWQSAGGSCAFPGDSTPEGLEKWLANAERTVDVWAVPHHGSKNSCYPDLYQQLSPKAAVVSAGRDNRYGHPHQEVLDALEAAHIPCYRTDQQGAVTVQFLPQGLRICPYLPDGCTTREKDKKI